MPRKTKRTRVTRDDIAKAREELLNQTATATDAVESPVEERIPSGRWHGLVYCEPYSGAWIATFKDGEAVNVYLGEEKEVLRILRASDVNLDDPLAVLNTINQFRREKETASYHLRSENDGGAISIPSAKPHRIIFKNAPSFLALLDALIAEGAGVPTIRKRLREKGYNVPYATLGRWIKKRKAGRKATSFFMD